MDIFRKSLVSKLYYLIGMVFYLYIFFTLTFHDYELSCYVGGKPEIQVGKAKNWRHSENMDFNLKRCNFSTLLSLFR